MEELTTLNHMHAAAPGGYTPRQRLAIVTSVSLLVLIMVGAAFATGVYVGNNRELAPGTFAGAGAPPRQGQPGGPQQPPAGQNPQPLAFDVQGSFQAVTATTVTIQGPDGPRTIGYDQATHFARPDGSTMKVTDLRVGMRLGIRLRPAEIPPTAATVTVLGTTPAPPPAQVPAGR